jgi:hypothetical protein
MLLFTRKFRRFTLLLSFEKDEHDLWFYDKPDIADGAVWPHAEIATK